MHNWEGESQLNDKLHKSRKDSQDKLWAYFQGEAPEVFEEAKPRFDFIIREIARKSGTVVPRVLNIGVGNGYLEETTQRLGWDIHSLDPDGKTIKRLIEKGIRAHRGYIERMSFNDASFNFVTASEVLEHLTDEQRHRGIGEVARVLERGGWFIGTVPYSENLFANQVVCPKCGEVFHRWGHQKSFDIKTIRDELSIFLDVVETKRTAFVSFREGSVKAKIRSFARLVLAKCGASIVTANIYFAARKLG